MLRLIFLLTLGGWGIAADGVIGFSGQVPCAGQLAVIDPGNAVLLDAAGQAIRLMLPSGGEGPKPIVVTVRSNCVYRVTAEWSGPPASGLRVVAEKPEPVAGMAHLAPAALDAAVSSADLAPNIPTVFVRGPRVSNGGNNLTPDNAILMRIISTPQSASPGIVTFLLSLGA